MAAQPLNPADYPAPVIGGLSVAGASPDIFASPIYKLIVGPNRTEMSAHEAVLLFSPVLAHHCAWAFKKEIRLEEDPTIFSRLLKFLYTNDFEPHWPTIPDRLIAVMSQDALISYAGIFAQLFVMADKYKLQKLKIAVMRKYDNIHTYLPVLKMWGVAEEICSRISEDDITFFDWFKNNPRRTYGPMMDIEVLDKVNFGRQLGMNILKAVCFQMNGHGENKQRNQRPDRERSNNTAEYGHHRKIDLNVAVVTLRTLVRELEGTGFNSNRRVRCLCGQRGCRECPENICFLWRAYNSAKELLRNPRWIDN